MAMFVFRNRRSISILKLQITVVQNVILISGIYLCFALALSLSVISASNIVDILSTVMFSVIILRIAEAVSNSFSGSGVQNQFAMEVISVGLLFPSILLELISVGFRSFSLGFRVFANVAAGHVLSDIALVARYTAITGIFTSIIHFVFSYIILIYELAVATIQVGVFSSLISVYVE